MTADFCLFSLARPSDVVTGNFFPLTIFRTKLPEIALAVCDIVISSLITHAYLRER